MKSNTVIMIGCWILMILYWTTDMFPGGWVPMAFCASYIIMWLGGAFKNENMFHADAADPDEHQLNDRQKDFQRKLQEGKEQELIDEISRDLDKIDVDLTDSAVIKMIDDEGNHSTIIIKPDGEIVVDGDPDQDIIDAAKMLKETVLVAGPEAVAAEIARQIEKMQRNGER